MKKVLDLFTGRITKTQDRKQMKGGMGVAVQGESEVQFQAKECAASRLSFADLCRRLEKLRTARKRDEKLTTMFPSKLRLALKNASPYPLFRLLLPHIDTRRPNYNVKQAVLAKLYVQVLGLDPKTSADAQMLLRTRIASPPRTLVGPKQRPAVYDWSEVLEAALIRRAPREFSDLTIGQVNGLLDQLAQAEDNSLRSLLVERISRLLSANEQKWLARIILQDLRVGIREKQILGFFHHQAMDLFAVTCDLRYICAELSESGRQVDQDSTGICLFRPFTPMLAAMLHHQLHKVEPAMKMQPFAIEPKVDGERLLVHKQGKEICWLTRSATVYTKYYGPVLSSYIIRNVEIEDCILDGEVVAWDFEHEANRTVALELLQHPDQENAPRGLIYRIFDIVYLNGHLGQSLLNLHAQEVPIRERRPGTITHLPFKVRRDLLEAVVHEDRKRVELMPHHRVFADDPEERSEILMSAFDKALAEREEGIVVKDLTSAYIMGEKSRSLMHWVKMKPEYSDQTTNLDVIVLGGYYSEGRRRVGQVASLLLGVATEGMQAAPTDGNERSEDSQSSNLFGEHSFPIIPWADEQTLNKSMDFLRGASSPVTEIPSHFLTLGRVGNGLTLTEWDHLERKLPFRQWPDRKSKLPSYLREWKAKKADVPDLWIDPRDSMLVEIKCMEIVESDSFSAGLSLRFPRIEALREDKPWHECMSLTRINELFDNPLRRGSRESRSRQDPYNIGRKRRRSATQRDVGARNAQRKRPLEAAQTFKTVEADGIRRTSEVFTDMEVCVAGDFQLEGASGQGADGSGNETDVSVMSVRSVGDMRLLTKQAIERAIVAAGGRVTALPRKGLTQLVIASRWGQRTAVLRREGNFDMVGLPYVLRCLREGQVLPPAYWDYEHMTSKTRRRLSLSFDSFGDNYTEEVDAVAIKRVFRKMEKRRQQSWRVEALVCPEVHQIMAASSRYFAIFCSQDKSRCFNRPALILHDRHNIFWHSFRLCIYIDQFADIWPLRPVGGKCPCTICRPPLPVTRLDHVAWLIRILGGRVVETLHVDVTHVVVDREDAQRFIKIARRLKELRRLPVDKVEKQVVDVRWVDACCRAGQIVPVRDEWVVHMPAVPEAIAIPSREEDCHVKC